MPRAYFVISDVHLCDVEDHTDGWKAYKSKRFLFDDVLDATVAEFLDRGGPDVERIVVLNGDVIDFDLITATPDDPPWPVTRHERRRGMRATEPKSIWKLEHVLADHPGFVAMLVRVLAGGHRLVYVMGNHDREFHFPGVQQALRDAVAERARADGLEVDLELLSFEPWFFYEPGEIYVEHGQQYDYYTSWRFVLDPMVPNREPAEIVMPMGNLSNRELMSEMGFFNPHASDYILNVYSYVMHWLRHYAFSRRNIAIPFLIGSVIVLQELIRTKSAVQRNPPDYRARLEAYALDKGLPLEKVQALERLKRAPITSRWYRVIREFWIDRMIVAAIMTGGTIALALVPIALWIKLVVPLMGFPLLFYIYEWFAHGETIFSAEEEAEEYARAIAEIVPARIVTFGHSHTPLFVPLGPDVSYVNTGTWAPVYSQKEHHELTPGLRNVLEARFDGERPTVWLTSTGDSKSSSRAPDHSGMSSA